MSSTPTNGPGAGGRTEPISVCMATYNGAAFLRAQVESILAQLAPLDELVVVDDASSDGTLQVLEEFGDARILVHRNAHNIGHVQSFARALSLARHDILFMSDQDDIWLPGRVAAMVSALDRSGARLVTGNSRFIDRDGRPAAFDCEGVSAARSARHASNILDIFAGRRNYYGCAMALRRELMPLVLPMPSFVESHDLWIAMAANVARANVHIDEETLARRVHGNNASVVSRPLALKLASRGVFLLSLFVLVNRLAFQRL
jgi:glycosyltransferase involved in cell wall biosynthesis